MSDLEISEIVSVYFSLDLEACLIIKNVRLHKKVLIACFLKFPLHRTSTVTMAFLIAAILETKQKYCPASLNEIFFNSSTDVLDTIIFSFFQW